MDPLRILREFIANQTLDQVVENDAKVDFGGRYSFDNTILTGYKSNEGKGDFYDLKTILYFARAVARPNYKFAEYLKVARDKGMSFVKLLDAKDVAEYLTGKVESSKYIVSEDHAVPSKRPRIFNEEEHPTAMTLDDTAEQTAVRAILINERKLRDRNTMLHVPGRSFSRIVNSVRDVYVHQDLARKKDEERRRKEAQQKAAREVAGPKPSGRFERETATDMALKQIGAQELGVQQVGFGLAPGSIRSHTNQQSAKELTAPVREPAQRPPPPSSSSRRKEEKPSSSRKKEGKPTTKPFIILVPNAASAILNMLNAKEFLQNSTFITPQESQSQGEERKICAEIQRKYVSSDGTTKIIKYIVSDKEPNDISDWKRVIAVFCLGKPWQFKSWTIFDGADKGDLVEVFQSIAGVYLHYADEPIDQVVRKWNVKLLPLSRHIRGNDEAVVREFWSHVDAFVHGRNIKGLLKKIEVEERKKREGKI